MSLPTTGVVAEFDEHRGLGAINADDGRRLPFHAMQIADGSRAIAAGTNVRFVVVAGHRGLWEAADVEVASA